MQSVALREGSATIGVWGPLAAASIYQAMVKLVYLWASNSGGLKLPTVGDILEGWCLPMMAEAIRGDEREREALKLFETLKAMGGKVEVNE